MEQLLSYLDEIIEATYDAVPEYKTTKVYIQPPAGMDMVYPCITISRDTGDTAFADNQVHRHQKRYQLTAIDEDPVSPLYDLLASLPRSTHNRSFPADNLNHDVFTILF